MHDESVTKHDHSGEGLLRDLEAMEERGLGRRKLLSFGALGGAALLVGCGSQSGTTEQSGAGGSMGNGPPGPPPQVDNGPVVTGTSTNGEVCTAYTTETNGPYPADGTNQSKGATSNILTDDGIMRSDVRTSIGTSDTAPGIPLELELTLVDVNADCKALAGYAIYIWHCDADGNYSLYDLPQETWLRGLQVSDNSGTLKFTTIFPGCYMGRYPHIHFEVFSSEEKATGGKYASLISQLALPAEDCAATYATDAYADSQPVWEKMKDISTDNVFGDNGDERIAAMTLELTGDPSSGYTGKGVIGLAL
ncbi:dioxygenase family protein [Croceicoccus mobilis]|uniref:Intradiol ring-cleavage dioxygenase n=1 Tax=Croceicoccus mobilis TaxID=1703339 RepID=A0A916Z155_9SPHN|nr:hypothetical protein [Croceicoccus mobilis]GGD71047.1 intradiol ring-cleavage dioxygenase [Croceicoccus mobilis]